MLKKLLNQSSEERKAARERELENKLIRHEARIGGEVFGPVPSGERREFFCLDERTWVWHEEWTDEETSQRRMQTTRYEVRPDCVLKVRDGQYAPVTEEEAENLFAAAKSYQAAVRQQLYTFAL